MEPGVGGTSGGADADVSLPLGQVEEGEPMKVFSTTRARPVHGSLVVAAMLLASLLTVPLEVAPAQAAFPGANGPIAFASNRDTLPGQADNDEIYVIDEQGTTRRLTNNLALDKFAAVSPNGKEIAFVSNRDDADNPNPEGWDEIYVMDVNDDDRDGNGDDLQRITNGPNVSTNPTWSPDGRKIAFAGAGAGFDIYVMDADGTEAPRRLTDSPGADTQPVFSPDGTKIAFLSRRDGNTDIWVMNADGSQQTRLTTHPALESQPEFSPDGTKLAFASPRDGTFDIYVMRAELESPTNVPVNLTNSITPMNARWPAWSADGTRIAYWYGADSGLGQDSEIYAMDADGSNPTNLTKGGDSDAWPDWGPARRAHK